MCCSRSMWYCGRNHCSSLDLWGGRVRRGNNKWQVSQSPHHLSVLYISERPNVLTLRWKAAAVLSPGADQSLKKMKQKISYDLICHFLGRGSAWICPLARHIDPVPVKEEPQDVVISTTAALTVSYCPSTERKTYLKYACDSVTAKSIVRFVSLYWQMEIFYDNRLTADAMTERSLAVLSENSVSIIVNRCTSCLKTLPLKKKQKKKNTDRRKTTKSSHL